MDRITKKLLLKFLWITLFLLCLYDISFSYEGAFENTYCPNNNCSHAMNIIDSFQIQFSVGQCQKCSKEYPNRVVHCKSNFTDHYYLNGKIISESEVDSIAYKLSQERQIEYEKKQFPPLLGWLIFFSIVCVIVIGIIGIVMGFRERAIFYYNYKDLGVCFVLPAALFVLFIIVALYKTFPPDSSGANPSLQKAAAFISPVLFILMCAVPVLYNFYKAFKHNPKSKWTAISVAIGRMLFMMVSLSLAWSSAPTGKGKDESDAEYAARQIPDMIRHAAVLSGIAWACHRLVNGKRAEQNKILETNAIVE